MLQLREKLQLLETSWPICSWCCCYHQQGGVQLGGAAQAFSWACLSCPVELLAPPLLFQVYKQAMGEKRSCLQHCESSLCCGSLWREAQSWAAAAPVCSTQRWLQKGGRKRLSRAVSVCLSAGLVLSCSTSEAMQRHCCICWARAGPFHSAGSSWACLDTCCGCEGTSVITCCFPGKF